VSSLARDAHSCLVTTMTTPCPIPPRDSRGRLLSSGAAVSHARRIRKLPARDCRGRFVPAGPSDAPSWYVFSADAYRIPAERVELFVPNAAESVVSNARTPAQSAPPRRAASVRRYGFLRDRWESGVVVLLFMLGCLAVHLTSRLCSTGADHVPHRDTSTSAMSTAVCSTASHAPVIAMTRGR